MSNFWQQLNKPFFCLAPMEKVTDVAFREMFARYSNTDLRFKIEDLKMMDSAVAHLSNSVDFEGGILQQVTLPQGKRIGESTNNFVMFTEFINVDGLTHPEGYKKLKIDLAYTEKQRPIVAQIWGSNPEKFEQAAKIIADMGFDGIDINMGCPQDKEIGVGACAALIRNPRLAQQIIAATKRGAGQLPVSVKTRVGYTKTDEMESWVKTLLEMEPVALTLHARTKQEKSKVPAHWDKITEAVALRDEMFAGFSALKGEESNGGHRPLIIGNGDVQSRQEGLQRIAQTGCDGVMIARGAFGYPWLFREDNYQPSVKERLMVMLEHAQLYEDQFKGIKHFVVMRKHFKAYASGFFGSHELRAKLMEAKDLEETKKIVEEYLENSI